MGRDGLHGSGKGPHHLLISISLQSKGTTVLSERLDIVHRIRRIRPLQVFPSIAVSLLHVRVGPHGLKYDLRFLRRPIRREPDRRHPSKPSTEAGLLGFLARFFAGLRGSTSPAPGGDMDVRVLVCRGEPVVDPGGDDGKVGDDECDRCLHSS
jgi:hypothetical protein